MATLAQQPVQPLRAERQFFQRMALGLAIFILFGFAQFAARGLANYHTAPLAFHLHGAAMTCWLALTALQSTLALRATAQPQALALHRKLGWLALFFIIALPLLGSYTLLAALRQNLVPPFFTPAFFLLLNLTDFAAFLGLVALALLKRANTSWHARAILGANIVLMEPALGRLLPMPLLGSDGQWLSLVVQAIPLLLLARHDRRHHGAIHPATKTAALVIFASHLIVSLGATTAPILAWAAALSA